jgi:hypothetical protein
VAAGAVALTAVTGFMISTRAQVRATVADVPGRVFTQAGVLPLAATFTDASHGFVLVARCGAGRIANCVPHVSVTSDGGATWVQRGLPAGSDGQHGGQLIALAGERLVFDQPDSFVGAMELGSMATSGPQGQHSMDVTTMSGYQPARRWLSPDAGRSWREVPRQPAGVVAEIPPGSRLFYPTPAIAYATMGPEPVGSSGVSFVRSPVRAEVFGADGTSVTLANPPVGEAGFVGAETARASDGSIWVAARRVVARTTVSGQTASDKLTFLEADIQVSRDRGRTWRSVTLPPFRGQSGFTTGDGHTLYLLDNESGSAGLTFSRDAGASWQTLELADPATGPVGRGPRLASMAALADGTALVALDGGLQRFDPRSATVTAVRTGVTVMVVRPAGMWAVASASDSMTHLATSDGLTWRRISLG